jgi:hypothetical protein
MLCCECLTEPVVAVNHVNGDGFCRVCLNAVDPAEVPVLAADDALAEIEPFWPRRYGAP